MIAPFQSTINNHIICRRLGSIPLLLRSKMEVFVARSRLTLILSLITLLSLSSSSLSSPSPSPSPSTDLQILTADRRVSFPILTHHFPNKFHYLSFIFIRCVDLMSWIKPEMILEMIELLI